MSTMKKNIKLNAILTASVVIISILTTATSFAGLSEETVVITCKDQNEAKIEIAQLEEREGDHKFYYYLAYRTKPSQARETLAVDIFKDEETRLLPKQKDDEEAPTENFIIFEDGIASTIYLEVSREQKNGHYLYKDEKLPLLSCDFKTKI